MPPPRHIAWIACLAVLFNMLAMPLSGAAPKGSAEQLLWGAFCSSGGKALVDVQQLAKIDLGPQGDDHAAMQHCWCCSGAAPVLAFGGQPPHLRSPAQRVIGLVDEHPVYLPTPRQQWPGTNPRASPLA
ncbi:DUF2946 domain-containing protein [Pseudomonas sp. RP23018S]|uniref:DUF2946 domain-containing protein n=1 Tax=Pseudomonas sp. RP23018S TaxID=3096037 RepID=UPI002ACAB875|nr:DUF2946 domain-containing protein [Pseudomonas sp. RP23018S]MDZ5604485.1 DUF2946 domain-containing protein [Pseudomonas sp. RP23018S]